MPNALVLKMLEEGHEFATPSAELVSFAPSGLHEKGGTHSLSRTFKYACVPQKTAHMLVERAQKAFANSGAESADSDGCVSRNFSAKDNFGNRCNYSIRIAPLRLSNPAGMCGVCASLLITSRDNATGKMLGRVAEALLAGAMQKTSSEQARIFKKPTLLFGKSSRAFSEPMDFAVEYV
ncbi:MAG: hypothetical protein WC792_01510 [Candidatus Micrarchaeia archaeon]|jgi:hypothetical protein